MGMTVGAVAEAAGVSAKAVRLWEARGLLPSAERTEAGYRVFTEEDLAVVCFIRRAKALGLTLTEIQDVIDLQRGGAAPCDRVIEMLDAHLDEIDRALSDLRRLRRSLASARRTAWESRRRGEEAVVCGILELSAS